MYIYFLKIVGSSLLLGYASEFFEKLKYNNLYKVCPDLSIHKGTMLPCLHLKDAQMTKVTQITSKSRNFFEDLHELFRYRELLERLVIRDIKVRYKQTVIGGLWAILQPFLTMVVFTVFFGKLVNVPSEGVPYAVFSYSGLLLWTYFSNTLTSSANSLISNQTLVSKIYLPRLLIPLSTTVAGLIDYGIASIIMVGFLIYYQFVPSVYIWMLPFVLFFTWMFVSGLGFWLSALNVKYRDVRYVVPFFTQLLIFVTPVIYPLSISGKFAWLLNLNPLTGLVETHRAILLNHAPINFSFFGVSIVLSIIMFLLGVVYFKKVEKEFADVI